MRSLLVFSLVALLGVVMAFPKEYYTDKYDNINLDEILENRRLLIPYIKCTLEQGKCSVDAKEWREHIRDAMETECDKCTDKQKNATRKIINHMITKEKDYWEQIKAKYDPELKYSLTYEEAVAKNEVDKLFTGSS